MYFINLVSTGNEGVCIRKSGYSEVIRFYKTNKIRNKG